MAPDSRSTGPSPTEADAYARLVVNEIRDIVLLSDTDRRIRFVTPSCRQLGYAPEEMVGQDAISFAHPDDIARMTTNIARLIAGESTEVRDRRYRIRLKDASYRWYESTPAVLPGDGGALSGLLTCLRDITDHMATEARHRLVADRIGDIVVQLDADDRVTYVSPSCSVLGYTPEEWMGRRAADLIHPGERAGVAASASRLLGGEDPRPGQKRGRLRHKDGSWRWFDGRPSRITDETGATVGIVNVLRDVTETHAAEQALAASERRYRLLADNMNDLLACSGRDGLLSFVAGAWREILGYEPEEMLGRDAPSFVHPDDLERVRQEFRLALKAGPGGGAFRAEYRARRKDGAYVWLEAHPRAYFDAAGEFVEFQDIVRDISAHKALEESLEAARQAAENTSKARAEFLADLAHELRGPLNSIQGLARLSRTRPRLIKQVRDYVTRIEQATGAILVQVEDVLEFSRLEAAKVVFRPRAVELEPFVRAALAQFEPAARAKGLELEEAYRAAAGLRLSFDPDRVRQVVLNLLDNATKFTSVGRVRLEVGYDPVATRLTVTVDDTGPGVPPDQIGQLFQRFVQASEAPAYRGAGLGLSISKRLVEGMGGEIGATSAPGRGSRFSFWIPAPAAEPDVGDPVTASEPRLRVLVADADPKVAAFVAEALRDVGAEVLTAADGATALDLVAREPVDLVFIDLALQSPEAHAVLRRLRRRRGLNMMTPALALVAERAELSVDGVRAEGFETLVPKPLTRVQLVSAVIQALRSPEPARAASAGKGRRTSPAGTPSELSPQPGS